MKSAGYAFEGSNPSLPTTFSFKELWKLLKITLPAKEMKGSLCQSLLFQLLGTRLTGTRGKREFGEINLGSGKPSAVLSGQPIQPS